MGIWELSVVDNSDPEIFRLVSHGNISPSVPTWFLCCEQECCLESYKNEANGKNMLLAGPWRKRFGNCIMVLRIWWM